MKKYNHQLTLKNYSDSTIQSYLNGLHTFIGITLKHLFIPIFIFLISDNQSG